MDFERRRSWFRAALGAPALLVSVLVSAQPSPLVVAPTISAGNHASNLRQAEAALAAIEAESTQLEQSLAGARATVARRGRILYRIRRAGALPFAGGFDSLLSHLSRVERLERLVRNDLESLAYLERREAALGEQATETRARVEQLREEASSAQRRAQERVALTTPWMGGNVVAPVPAYGQIVVRGAQPERFTARRGSLPLPVRGGAIRSGERDGAAGLEFLSPNAEVTAVGAGRIAFSRPYRGYGHLIIVEHGEGYFSLYGGLQEAGVAEGDVIARGELLGSVGSAPLFFEVREGTRTLDARSWLGL